MSKVLAGIVIALALFSAAFFSPPKDASAEALYFDVVNYSAGTVFFVYASPAGSGYWTGDLLVDELIFPREVGEILFDDGLRGCFYDLKFATDRGDAWLWGVDLCVVDTVTLY